MNTLSLIFTWISLTPWLPASASTTSSPSSCSLPPLTGPCRAKMERYFYNGTSLTCGKFIYGGCQGNGNNFETEQGCENTCGQHGRVPISRVKTIDFESGFEDWEGRDVSVVKSSNNSLEIPASDGGGHKIATAGRDKVIFTLLYK